MPLFFAIAAGAALSVIALLVFSLWGLPFVVLAVAALLTYVVVARRQDGSVATIERGKATEPTGRPRKASGGAGTANERIGT
jgi:hypothetical protein